MNMILMKFHQLSSKPSLERAERLDLWSLNFVKKIWCFILRDVKAGELFPRREGTPWECLGSTFTLSIFPWRTRRTKSLLQKKSISRLILAEEPERARGCHLIHHYQQVVQHHPYPLHLQLPLHHNGQAQFKSQVFSDWPKFQAYPTSKKGKFLISSLSIFGSY